MTCRQRLTRIALVLFPILTVVAASETRAQVRLGPAPAENLTPAQRESLAAYVAKEKAAPPPPMAIMLRVPAVFDASAILRRHFRFERLLNSRVSEFGILLVARDWTQHYEWNSHDEIALKAGVTADTIAAIADGRRPAHMQDDEAALYDLFMELTRNHSVSDDTYARALRQFGEDGVVDATALLGYYTSLAMLLNLDRTSAPPSRHALEPFPR